MVQASCTTKFFVCVYKQLKNETPFLKITCSSDRHFA